MSKPDLIAIAAGGTGGHMFPAQAFAEEMLARGYACALCTDERGLRYADGFPPGVERVEFASASFGRGRLTQRIGAPVTLARGVLSALNWRRKQRPVLTVGFGGYAIFPALTAARLMRAPYIIHEQDGVLGRANRLFANGAAALSLGVETLQGAPANVRQVYNGGPVRAAALAHQGAPYAPPLGAINLLVFGGSQGAGAFAKLIPQALALLPEDLRARIRLTQQVRAEDEAAFSAPVRAEIAPFFEDMPVRIAQAHLVIARAGASSINELAVIGRPALLIPYPHAAHDHQSANARAVEALGAAVMAAQKDLIPQKLAEILTDLFNNPAKLEAMAKAALARSKPDAAQGLADLAQEIIRAQNKKG